MSPFMTETNTPNDIDRTRELFPHIDADPTTLPSTLDPFTITTSTGFMPLRPPRVYLPVAFDPIQKLVQQLPVVKSDGTPGLLATYNLGHEIDKGVLPNLTDIIDTLVSSDGQSDLENVTAVFREYAFLASAYLLEPCWERYDKGLEGYGLGRQTLPRCIAGPLTKTAKMLSIHPFMSYAAAYCLYNYRFNNPSIGTSEYSNLQLIRAFEKGLDSSSSEAGFVLTHVDMVKHSAGLVNGTVSIMDGIANRDGREDVTKGFEGMLETMTLIEASMETMWGNSKPAEYNTFRAFIFGITNQSMFPNGVVYEGENDNEPLFFRGESGANDSMIPLLDGLLQIPMPQNPLTDILKAFRSYRPLPHRQFLAYVRDRAEEIGVREYCCKDIDTAVLYLRLLDHVRSFRWRHWLFAREYIIRRTGHPTATGGRQVDPHHLFGRNPLTISSTSPIVTWLPNQLFAVMDLMTSVWKEIADDDKEGQPQFVFEMMANVEDQRVKLKKEVDRWCQERGV